jgi:hypothetical protein
VSYKQLDRIRTLLSAGLLVRPIGKLKQGMKVIKDLDKALSFAGRALGQRPSDFGPTDDWIVIREDISAEYGWTGGEGLELSVQAEKQLVKINPDISDEGCVDFCIIAGDLVIAGPKCKLAKLMLIAYEAGG